MKKSGAMAAQPLDSIPAWYRYWGKAQPESETGAGYHLLAYHSLDVAACGLELLRIPRFSLGRLAGALKWPLEQVEALFVYFLALHDVGKFSRGFQSVAPNLSPELVPPRRIAAVHRQRHDTLGWLLWRDVLSASSTKPMPDPSHEFWQVWARAVMGHHGLPPRELEEGGRFKLRAADHFLPDDREAALGFVGATDRLFSIGDVPSPARQHARDLLHFSWTIAGLAVLADWLGSNQKEFGYRSAAMPLTDYWENVAKPTAQRCIARAGLGTAVPRQLANSGELLPEVTGLSPLQQYAATAVIDQEPQLFILEDVTGAGKTEAALLLAQRLMAAGQAHGFYFALPTMATATQMYDRVAGIYRRMFAPESHPSLVLAHSARDSVEGFRDSIIRIEGEAPPRPSQNDPGLDAGAECAAWLADSRKKALLAEVGVGTIDQALLSVMPVRHQSLRMLGLLGKVLIVDEVHAYDSYPLHLLKVLLEHHARSGGSAILLSATIPHAIHSELCEAFARGRGESVSGLHQPDSRYPLATHYGSAVRLHACETREPLKRTVKVVMLHDEAEVIARIRSEAGEGRCVAWIRNTVHDARRGYRELTAQCRADAVTLFHSRFALGDRLAIEDVVKTRFGKASTGAERQSQIVVGTQVLEQSLDYDVDVMVSDWAPVDLIIQRAGRLMRHVRTASGDPSLLGLDARGEAVLYVLVPPTAEPPDADWYSALFPKGQYVYPDAGRLWLGANAVTVAQGIVTPGEPGALGAVRSLVEAVYGEAAAPIPDALQEAAAKAEGKGAAERSMGSLNSLRLDQGYGADSSILWHDDDRLPTRLGEESRTIYLAVERIGQLTPLRSDLKRPWEASAVRADARRFVALGAEWEARFGGMVSHLRATVALLQEPAFVLPLAPAASGGWRAVAQARSGSQAEVWYDDREGLR